MSDAPQNVLELADVTAGYGATSVLESLSLNLAPGESISVIGRNGVGKSTLLATIMGHTALHAGAIRLNGAEISRLPVYQRARHGIAYVPQEREIFPSLTVRENLHMAARPEKWPGKWPGKWNEKTVTDLFTNLRARLHQTGANYPVASNRCSRWPAPSWPIRAFCSWTSRVKVSRRLLSRHSCRCSPSCAKMRGYRLCWLNTIRAWRSISLSARWSWIGDLVD